MHSTDRFLRDVYCVSGIVLRVGDIIGEKQAQFLLSCVYNLPWKDKWWVESNEDKFISDSYQCYEENKAQSERVTMVEKNVALPLSEGLAFELSQLCGEGGELWGRGLQAFYTGAAILLEEVWEDLSDVAQKTHFCLLTVHIYLRW